MFLRKDYMENKIIIGNMKMYMNIDDVNNYIDKIGKIIDDVIICPTNIYIPYFLQKGYNLGIQNVYYEDNGAYTGEVSVIQTKKLGINYVIIGHSERRKYFFETDYDVNRKMIKSLDNNLNVILCIGEELDDRNNMNIDVVLRGQLEIALNNVLSKYEQNIIIAYEPRWAIGTGLIPNNNEIRDSINFIKSFVFDKFKMNVKVVYGGSVTDSNIEILNEIENVDGFMVGGCCTNPDKFLKIISVVESSDI